MAQKVGNQGFYALGPKLLVLAEEYRRSFTMRDRVLPFLDQLVHVTGETAIYCERYQQDSCADHRASRKSASNPHGDRNWRAAAALRRLVGFGDTGDAFRGRDCVDPEPAAVGKIYAVYAQFAQADRQETR